LLATRCPTPRGRDRMTWAAILAIGGRIDQHGARRRLELAVKDKSPSGGGSRSAAGTSNEVSDPGPTTAADAASRFRSARAQSGSCAKR
jgi:hypothetical protein